MRVLILGGYGKAGQHVARLLLENRDLALTLAGRNEQRAQQAALTLGHDFPQRRKVRGLSLDAQDKKALQAAFEACDLVVVCLPFKGNGQQIVTAAFEAGINYIDINPDEEKHRALQELDEDIQAAGLTFITDAGFIPGLPAWLTFLAAADLDEVDDIIIGSVWNDPALPMGGAYDVVSNLDQPPLIFENRGWRKESFIATRLIDFGQPFGRRWCFPISLTELEALPRHLSIKQLKLYQSGYNWVSDLILFLWKSLRLSKNEAGIEHGAKLFRWSIMRFAVPPYGGAMVLHAFGVKDGQPAKFDVTLYHKDLYTTTAIPVVATIFQLLDRDLKQTGYHFMGHAVASRQFLEQVKELGLKVSLRLDKIPLG